MKSEDEILSVSGTDKKRILWLIAAFALIAGLLRPVCGIAAGYNTGDKKNPEKEMVAVDLLGETRGYSTVLYDNTNGLPTSEANAIAESDEGFIWIGSYGGLIRYDGKDFERIDSTTGISSVVELYIDSSQRLWIGTNDNGAAVKIKDSYVKFNLSHGLKSASIRSIAEDSDGYIYIATTQGIACVDRDMNLSNIEDPEIADIYSKRLVAGNDGNVYGISTDGSVFVLKGGSLSSFYSGADLGISDIRSILPDPEKAGYVYIGTSRSTVYYGRLDLKMGSASQIDVSPISSINSMAYMDGILWICADNGIGLVENGVCRKLDSVPMNNSVEHIIADYQGNLWFTSSRQGVMKIVPSRFMDITDHYDLKEEVTNTTCMYRDSLFIGKDMGLDVLKKDGKVQEIELDKAQTAAGEDIECTGLIGLLSESKIRSIVRDSSGNLWISTFGSRGLVKFNGREAICFTESDGMPSKRVRTVIECADGSMAAACTGGVVIIKNDSVSRIYGEEDGITNTEVLTIACGNDKDLIAGTDGGGIYVIGSGTVRHISQKDGMSSGIVMRIKKDAERDIYWVVTSNSIEWLDNEYNVKTVEKFPYANNFDLYENKAGDMWILSSNGVYVTTAENMLKNGDIEYVHYDRENGLTRIATANAYSELTEDGNLYIACTTGVIEVNIDLSFDSVDELKVSIPFIDADGTRIYPDDNGNFNISKDVNKVTIYSYVFTYSLIDPKVTYYLDGFDSSKSTVKRSELTPIDYTNLKGGDYRFVLSLKDSQMENPREISVRIIKEKKIYEYFWFNMICIILIFACAAGIVSFIVYKKIQKIKKKEQEQRELVREITKAFAKTIDMKDPYTNGHSFRVAEYTAMLAKELGYDEETVEKYYNIALLHDIGKIGIPPEVLNKNGKLTDEEFGRIKSHTTLGYDALKDISIMPELAIGAHSHHERPDGKGYPQGLKGDAIPRVAQIIAVADTFDAMYSTRPYRKRMNYDKVVSIIESGSGTQLEADVVEAFLRLAKRGDLRAADDDGGGSEENIVNTK